jgi:hypothetical protein
LDSKTCHFLCKDLHKKRQLFEPLCWALCIK